MAAAAPSHFCDPCKNIGKEQVPVSFCLECRGLYCKICLSCHKKMKATASHSYMYLSGDEPGRPCRCDSCNKNEILNSLCSECRELYCSVCANSHRSFKATKHHVMLDIKHSNTDSSSTSTDLPSCSIGFDVTYSGAQVSVKQNSPHKTNPPIHTDKQDGGNATYVPLQADPNKQTTPSATVHCKFSVATPSNTKTNINRMIAMPDGRMCIVDFDTKIQLLSENYALCDEISLERCYAVTCVDNDTVAILVRKDKGSDKSEIINFSVKGNKFKPTRTKTHIDGYGFDIACRRGVFITRYMKDKTDYTRYGNKIIARHNRSIVLSDFLHYDSVSDCVLVSNFMEDTIICYTMEGNVKWSSTQSVGPKGMVVVHGVVLVAANLRHAIIQISMDGRMLSDPLLTKDHGIIRPYAITYQAKQHRLLVTGSRDSGNVMVFNLSE